MLCERRDQVVAGVLALCAVIALILAATAYGAGEYEPNDSRETAAGPLAGGTDYTATFETDNDVDWYVFYIKVYSQMDFSATTVGGCGSGYIYILDKDGKSVDSLRIGSLNQVNHRLLTLPAGRYYLDVTNEYGCTSDRYKLRIDPAAAVTPSKVCGEAIVAREAVGPELAKLNEKLGYVNNVVVNRTAKVQATKKRLKRLKKNRASRYAKADARRDLAAAKTSLNKALEKKLALETLGGQYAASLNTANAQIATSC
ncbi:MAG TPA: hypothetical protein VFB52_11695 [Solirubrobacterales bacterium]|nr:hypothetical protein [Solirubrobacterales bacterium]